MPVDFFSDRRWFLLLTKPRQEDRAADKLTLAGYRVWAPKIREQRLRARKVEIVEGPLFPPYLFVGLAEEQPFPPILTTPGVARVVGIGGEIDIPVEIGRYALKRLAALHAIIEAEGGVLDRVPKAPLRAQDKFAAGDAVRALEGPFANFIGRVRSAKGSRVRAMMALFGRETPVEYDMAALELVG